MIVLGEGDESRMRMKCASYLHHWQYKRPALTSGRMEAYLLLPRI